MQNDLAINSRLLILIFTYLLMPNKPWNKSIYFSDRNESRHSEDIFLFHRNLGKQKKYALLIRIPIEKADGLASQG